LINTILHNLLTDLHLHLSNLFLKHISARTQK